MRNIKNKDGIEDIIALGRGPMNWSHLKIASWKDDNYIFLWDGGKDEFVVEQSSFGINKNGEAQIKV